MQGRPPARFLSQSIRHQCNWRETLRICAWRPGNDIQRLRQTGATTHSLLKRASHVSCEHFPFHYAGDLHAPRSRPRELRSNGGLRRNVRHRFCRNRLACWFFLPGDSLLFTAGFLASQGYLDISLLLLVCFIAAVVGGATGYAIGRNYGRRLFEREDSKLFRKEYLLRAEQFFVKHGGKAVILARFIPIVRTFVPVVSGMGAMEYRRFAIFNVVGALLWAVGVTLAGYFLGTTIPNIDRYLLPIIFLILLASVLPPAIHVWRENGDQIKAFARLKLDERKARP